MSDKSIFASTAAKAGTDARPPPPSPAKTRAHLALLDVRYVLEILLIDPDLIEEQIVGKQVNHVFQLTALDVEEDPLPGIIIGLYTVCDTNVLMIMSLTMSRGSCSHR